MVKAPPVSYGGLKLAAKAPAPEAAPPAAVPAVIPAGQGAAPAGELVEYAPEPSRRRPIEAKADPTLVYMSPEAKLALKHFALARGPKVKVHDLLIEALEEWGERKGMHVTWRVPSARPRRAG